MKITKFEQSDFEQLGKMKKKAWSVADREHYDEVCVRSAEIIKDSLPNATYYKFDNKGHFTKGDLGTEEFPELLEEIIK